MLLGMSCNHESVVYFACFCSFFISYCFLMFADGELNFTYHELSTCNSVCTVLKCLRSLDVGCEYDRKHYRRWGPKQGNHVSSGLHTRSQN